MRPTQQTIKVLRTSQKARLEKMAKEGYTKEKMVEERKRMAAQIRALRQVDKAIIDSQKYREKNRKL